MMRERGRKYCRVQDEQEIFWDKKWLILRVTYQCDKAIVRRVGTQIFTLKN